MKQIIKNMILSVGVFLSLLFANALFAESNQDEGFDHSTTGYILTGQHTILSCESCHVRGVFKGTPKTCEGCHERASQIAVSLKPVNHVITNSSCDDCHTDSSWTVVRMDHGEFTGACFSCHNGLKAEGKPITHVQSSNECDDCHLSVSWVPARFIHTDVTAQCITCHNDTVAQGKPVDHVISGTVCDDCHSQTAWKPATFLHDDVTATCVSCHNGGIAEGKSARHVTSSNVCDDCHTNTKSWTPAKFIHTDITDGCNTCHNGSPITGMGLDHFITTEQCDVCHRTTGWIPTTLFDHQSANYPGDHTGSGPDCIDCHTGNSQTITWKFSYDPECVACHMDDYNQEKHEKFPISPDYLDCSSTCHKPEPQHNVRDGDWAK